MNIEKLIHTHENFVRSCLKKKGEVAPMIAFKKGENLGVIPLTNVSRVGTELLIESVKRMNTDWYVFMKEKSICEDYETNSYESMMQPKDLKKEIVILAVTKGHRRISRYEKIGDDMKKISEDDGGD